MSIDYVNTTTSTPKGTFHSMPVEMASMPCEFYWICDKSDGSHTKFHVGVPWRESREWLSDAFGRDTSRALANIQHISEHSFELCDNVDASGRRRVALYGIV